MQRKIVHQAPEQLSVLACWDTGPPAVEQAVESWLDNYSNVPWNTAKQEVKSESLYSYT